MNTHDGEEVVFEIVTMTAETRTWRMSNGCLSTTLNAGFSPETKWENCRGKSGEAVVELKGNPYPLKVGNEWQYTQRVGSWIDIRTCRVTGTETVTVPAGTFGTLVVECRSRKDRTFWVAPSNSHVVKYRKVSSKTQGWELVRVGR